MSKDLMTSTMKSDVGIPEPCSGASGVPVSAAAPFADGRRADGFAGSAAVGAGAAMALLSRSVTAVTAPAAATVPKKLRRLTPRRDTLSDMNISLIPNCLRRQPCVRLLYLAFSLVDVIRTRQARMRHVGYAIISVPAPRIFIHLAGVASMVWTTLAHRSVSLLMKRRKSSG